MGHELCESRTSLGSELRTLESKLRMSHEPYAESRTLCGVTTIRRHESRTICKYASSTIYRHESRTRWTCDKCWALRSRASCIWVTNYMRSHDYILTQVTNSNTHIIGPHARELAVYESRIVCKVTTIYWRESRTQYAYNRASRARASCVTFSSLAAWSAVSP